MGVVKDLKKSLLLQHKNIILILFLILIFSTLFIFLSIYNKDNNLVTVSRTINTKDLTRTEEKPTNIIGEKNIEEAREVLNLKKYENMPKEINGYKVIGKITIPKIEVEKYILEETTEEALLESVTKICGPDVNKTGNLCLAGHNYGDTFGKISSLENGDEIEITDTYNRTTKYQVYSMDRVSPYDTSCLSQNTSAEREITLVTCTLGAIKRVVVKAIEVYD